jgi:hypothetical protein
MQLLIARLGPFLNLYVLSYVIFVTRRNFAASHPLFCIKMKDCSKKVMIQPDKIKILVPNQDNMYNSEIHGDKGRRPKMRRM